MVKPNRALRAPYWKAWSPVYEGLFDMPGSDWTRPAEVHVRPTRAGLTVTARFVLPSGLPATAVARVRVRGTSATVDREDLRFPMRTQAAGSGPVRDGRGQQGAGVSQVAPDAAEQAGQHGGAGRGGSGADDDGSRGEHGGLSNEVRR